MNKGIHYRLSRWWIPFLKGSGMGKRSFIFTLWFCIFCWVVAPQVHADWINLSGAQNSPNIAEIYINDDQVRVNLEIFVNDITQTPTINGRNYRSNAVVTIRDINNNPVANATVYITWSGVVSGSASGVTGADGTVTFVSAKLKSHGPFTITVDNVTHATLPYNPALNIETSDTATF